MTGEQTMTSERDPQKRLRELARRVGNSGNRVPLSGTELLYIAAALEQREERIGALTEERDSLLVEYKAAAALTKKYRGDLDTLREWCKSQGILPADLPSPTSFDRELHKRLHQNTPKENG